MPMRTAQDQRSHVELITIYEICRILGASLAIDRTFRDALNVLAAHLGLARAMIVTPVPDEGRLGVHSSVGLTRQQEQRGTWKHGEGVIGHVYASGMAAVVPDVAQSPEFIDRTGAFGAPDDGSMMAFVVVPLKTDKAVVGVLAAQKQRTHRFAQSARATIPTNHRMIGGSRDQQLPRLTIEDLVVEDDPHRPWLSQYRIEQQHLIIARRLVITDLQLIDGEQHTVRFHLVIGVAQASQPLCPRLFKPAQRNGVVYNAHLIRVGVKSSCRRNNHLRQPSKRRGKWEADFGFPGGDSYR